LVVTGITDAGQRVQRHWRGSRKKEVGCVLSMGYSGPVRVSFLLSYISLLFLAATAEAWVCTGQTVLRRPL
jgi:hypothetical protein